MRVDGDRMIGRTRLFISLFSLGYFAGAVADAVAQESSNDRLGLFPISAALCNDMKSHNVLNSGAPVSCARLKLVRFEHIGFDGLLHRGEIMVMDAAANDVLQIFNSLLEMNFPIEKARLINYYNGDDDESIADNNTSGFNHRNVEGGNALSMHAYGLAIDLNPKQNPYVKRNRNGTVLSVSPPSGIDYVSRPGNRSPANGRLGMAEAVTDLFAEHGFSIWGGYWHYEVDYQHFQVSRGLALRLAHLLPADAQALFDEHVRRYLSCRREGRSGSFCVNRE
jgi:D-alanyl-D-alanine carboxypeptidase-like protein